MSESLSRRDVMRGLAAAGLAAVGGASGGAPPPTPAKASVPLADLRDGARVVVEVDGFPVEVAQAGDAVRARFLLCTHLGCRVNWDESTARYLCACHEGAFAEDGRPLAGPATEPLRAVPFAVEGEAVVFR